MQYVMQLAELTFLCFVRFLGREKECKEMRKLLHTVTTDERQAGLVQHMVIIEGEAGIGKTRLIEEFMDIAEDENFRSASNYKH